MGICQAFGKVLLVYQESLACYGRTSKGAWIEISNALALKRSADVDTQLEVSISVVSNTHVINIKWREIE